MRDCYDMTDAKRLIVLRVPRAACFDLVPDRPRLKTSPRPRCSSRRTISVSSVIEFTPEGLVWDFCAADGPEEGPACRAARLRSGLDFALDKRANITHGDGEVVLSLQVDPELRSVAEVAAEA